MSINDYPKVRDIFGMHVFDRRKMKELLPKNIYESLIAAMEGRQKLDTGIADTVALIMKDWAISKGATHWAHWFHPLTENTAEKHQAFVTASEHGTPVEIFNGSDLVQGEPDASSFPSGGLRSTFEARGYNAWDPSSPAFIVRSPKGGTLCIPSVFLSYDGTPLDLKTTLLRSLSAIETRALRLLKVFGQRGVRYVRATVGAEQEFFLLDRPRAQKRPDVRFCGKTVLGARPAKDQRLDHHYFGAISQRVLSYMEDVERDLSRIGIAIATRHNEVARCQFEFAPLYCEANLAADQNQIIMETMRKLAQQHELRLLFHEKPFADMNGSGKHINFSLEDSEGRNLLQPSTNQRKNVIFLTFLAGFLLGVSRYHGLLRAATATAGNMYRLGGHEAPPSIVSVYLGQALTDLLKAIVSGQGDNAFPEKSMIDLGLGKLPSIEAFSNDRNRTSPIAFTGNKFEFRAPGASQSLGTPVTMIYAIWAWGIERMIERIECKCQEQSAEAIEVALSVVRDVAIECEPILFEGDSYSTQWHAEARRRGLVVAETIPDAIDLFQKPENMAMLKEMGIYDERQVEIFHEIRMEAFTRAIEIEMAIMNDMLHEGILPAMARQLILERDSLHALDGLDFSDGGDWASHIGDLGRLRAALMRDSRRLTEFKQKLAGIDSSRERADLLIGDVVPHMEATRAKADAAEIFVAADIWPYPNYRSLLSLSA